MGNRVTTRTISRRQFLRWSAGTLIPGTLGVVGYTLGIEPHWVDIHQHNLPIRGLPAALSGRRLVQISDLHVGPQVAMGYLIKSLQKVAALEPDFLAITGDLITYRSDAQFAELRRLLAHLPPARIATLAVLGNHDYGRHWRQGYVAESVCKELARAGVRVLRNESEPIHGLVVAGVDDLWAREFAPDRALAKITADTPALVLCHNPDAADHPGWGDYQGWILSGHTHGGQCKPPFLPPPLQSVHNPRYVAGEVPLADGRRLYINRGLGHLVPARFNARPEITVFTLREA